MIRPADLPDADAIATIHVRTWQSTYRDLLPTDYLARLSVSQRKAFWEDELRHARSRILVFEDNHRVCGWISAGASRDADSHGAQEIYAFYVEPEQQRRGIGTHLLTAAEASLPTSGDLTIWVLSGNHGALAFYESRGYVSDGFTKQLTLGGTSLTDVRLRKVRTGSSRSPQDAARPPPRIRLATAADTVVLQRLFLEVRRATFTWKAPESFTEADFEEQTLGESVWVAEGVSGDILGFISIWEPDAFIHHLFVRPQDQRHGVGRALLEHTRRWLPLPHRLKCLELNTRALRFYLKEGWTEIGQGGSQESAYRHLEYAVPAEPPSFPGRSTIEVTPTRSAYPSTQNQL